LIGREVTARRTKRRRDSFLGVAVALLLLGPSGLLIGACQPRSATTGTGSPSTVVSSSAAEITFIDLGSVGCAPCKAMQSIMDGVERDYGERVLVVFYDVNDQPDMARAYGVQMIPTQVFLDADGNEFYRHVGVLPREEIDALLAERGVTPVGQ